VSFFDEIAGTKVSIRNYKSFGDEPQGFEGFSPANIIVGRNNSGKSALLDLVQFCCGNYQFAPFTNNKAASRKLSFVFSPATPLSRFGSKPYGIRKLSCVFGKVQRGRREKIRAKQGSIC